MHKLFFLERCCRKFVLRLQRNRKQNAFSLGYPEIGKRIH